MTSWRRTRLAALMLVMVLALATGCGPDEGGEADYEPVPDAELFAEVAELPGVTRAELHWTDDFSIGDSYGGEVEVEQGTDGRDALDRTIAILRQGRPDAAMRVVVLAPDRTWRSTDLGVATIEELEKRYGPQPGDGTPPTEQPTP